MSFFTTPSRLLAGAKLALTWQVSAHAQAPYPDKPIRIPYPKHGRRLKVHGTPWQFSETPARAGIAPERGDHNDAALAELVTVLPRWRVCGRGRSS